jgi:hypothetical protein
MAASKPPRASARRNACPLRTRRRTSARRSDDTLERDRGAFERTEGPRAVVEARQSEEQIEGPPWDHQHTFEDGVGARLEGRVETHQPATEEWAIGIEAREELEAPNLAAPGEPHGEAHRTPVGEHRALQAAKAVFEPFIEVGRRGEQQDQPVRRVEPEAFGEPLKGA